MVSRVAVVNATKKGQRLEINGTKIGGASVGQVQSQDGRRQYVIGFNDNIGRYTCSCPAWKFQRGPRAEAGDCKHIRAFLATQRGEQTNLTVRKAAE